MSIIKGIHKEAMDFSLLESQNKDPNFYRLSFSLKSDISSLLKRIIKIKKEKHVEVLHSELVEEDQRENLISMNEVRGAEEF